MSLVPDYSSSSDDEIFEENKNTERQTKKIKLPSADLLLSKENPGEVFNNPYKEAEDAKFASLEKHVKMVDTGIYVKKKNGKMICWNSRKGRCRFGNNCTFAHDSDLLTETDETSVISTVSRPNKDISATSTISKPQQGLQLGNMDDNDLKDKTNKRNRSASGGDAVVPIKKVLRQYPAQKKKIS